MLCQKGASFISGPVDSVSQEEQDLWDGGGGGLIMARKGLFLSVCCDAGGKSYFCACVSFGIVTDFVFKLTGGIPRWWWEQKDQSHQPHVSLLKAFRNSARFTYLRPFINSLLCGKAALPAARFSCCLSQCVLLNPVNLWISEPPQSLTCTSLHCCSSLHIFKNMKVSLLQTIDPFLQSRACQCGGVISELNAFALIDCCCVAMRSCHSYISCQENIYIFF